MAFYTCQVCKYLFDDKSRGVPFDACRRTGVVPNAAPAKATSC